MIDYFDVITVYLLDSLKTDIDNKFELSKFK
jgi:hypothetical protein